MYKETFPDHAISAEQTKNWLAEKTAAQIGILNKKIKWTKNPYSLTY